MKIKLYNEPRGGSIGGCEVMVAVLAQALSQEHEVEIIHHRASMTGQVLAKFAGLDLGKVTLSRAPTLAVHAGSPWKVIPRWRKERREETTLSGNCDVFVSFNHEAPVFCAAPLGILIVLFPFTSPERMIKGHVPKGLRRTMQVAWHGWKLKSRLANYQVMLAISEFSRCWTRRRWATEADVLYPPVETNVGSLVAKENLILSVGRFSVEGHGKKQAEMLRAYAPLREAAGMEWSYSCVGAGGASEQEREFLARTQELATEVGAQVIANVARPALLELYQRASIFWHATGMDSDEELRPEEAEHFGITTVEAMAAGCVPVVINRGAQPEIVEHGVSGFLWNNLEELQACTKKLQKEPALLRDMSRAARIRAENFSRERCVARFQAILGRYIPDATKSSSINALTGLAAT